MSLQMVHVNEGNAQRACKALSEVYSHKKRPHEARPTCEGNGRELLLVDARPFDGLANHGHYILLVSTTGQFRHHATVGFVNGL